VVERIVEKAVPTPDPDLIARLDELQKRIVAEQRKTEAAEKKRLETQDHYKRRLNESDKHTLELSEKLAQAQAALQAIGQSRKAEDVALTHGGTLLFQLRSAAAPLLAAWPKLAPLSIHCRLPDIEAVAEVQAIAEQLAPIVEALHRVIQENQADPSPVIDITSRQPALPT
jgi:type VI protein secretion system component VasF